MQAPPEIHDPPDAGAPRRVRNVLRRSLLGLGEFASPAHGVDEIVDDVDVEARGLDRVRVVEIALHHLDIARPRDVAQLVGSACQNPHAVPGRDEPGGSEAAADVAGRPR